MKGFKVFNPDWKCLDFQYEVGKTFKHEGKLFPCKSGFHFCKNLIDCFSYYIFDPANRVAEVEAIGNIDTDDDAKYVTDEIKIVRELNWHEVLDMCNTGKGNTGYGNTGNQNSGNWNSGNHNSGRCNSGNCNTGIRNTGKYNSGNGNTNNWNSGNCNSGYENYGNWNSGSQNFGNRNSGYFNSGNYNTGKFNSVDYETGFFNNTIPKTIRIFNNCIPFDKINDIINNLGFNEFERNFVSNEWIPYDDMSDEEKDDHPEAKIVGGYLKKYTYQEACRNSWNHMDDEDKEEFKKLPNFDPVVFKDITGIDINA